MSRSIEETLDKARQQAEDFTPGINQAESGTPMILACGTAAIVHALLYVGDCIRALRERRDD